MNRPKGYRNDYIIHPEQQSAVEHIFELAKSGRWVGIINPDSGIGKTRTACEAARLEYHSRHPYDRPDVSGYVFITAFRLGMRLKQAGINFEDELEKIGRVHCLILDDLGKESENTVRLIEEVIYQLYNNDRQLIFTSGLDRTRLRPPRYDGAVIQRLVSRGEIVELPAIKGKQ